MSWTGKRTTPRSAKSLFYEQLRKTLSAQGYYAPAVCLTAPMRYRLIVVLLNHLATALDRDPKRVYNAALNRAERTRIGRPFTPSRQARAQEERRLEDERVRRMIGYCPECGADLIGEPGEEKEKKRQRRCIVKKAMEP